MVTCPLCRRGSLRLSAAITRESVMTRILPRLKLASVPPPMAPARCRQARVAFGSAHDPWRGLGGDVRAATVYAALCACEISFEISPPLSLLTPAGPRPSPRRTLRRHPHRSCAACPGRALPLRSLLRTTLAGSRWALEPQPAPQAKGVGRRRCRDVPRAFSGVALRKCRRANTL